MNKDGILTAIVSVGILTVIMMSIAYFSRDQKNIIGPLLIVMSFISLMPSFFYKIPIKILKSDILFGLIDNGILVIFAIIGAEFFGVFGAITGGAIGNAVTDGFAGIFEGQEAQKTKNGRRTALTVSMGKIAGCLFGAGIVLTVAWTMLKL